MFGLSDNNFNCIIKTIELNPKVEKAIIFGSRAMGNYKPGSDIDIAVYGSKITTEEVIRLSNTLNEDTPLPYKFDVINYNTLTNNDLRLHIDEKGICIFKRLE